MYSRPSPFLYQYDIFHSNIKTAIHYCKPFFSDIFKVFHENTFSVELRIIWSCDCNTPGYNTDYCSSVTQRPAESGVRRPGVSSGGECEG